VYFGLKTQKSEDDSLKGVYYPPPKIFKSPTVPAGRQVNAGVSAFFMLLKISIGF